MIIIDQNEFDFLKGDEQITHEDIVEIIEHREVFEKLCRKSIRKIRIDLSNLHYKGREAEAYCEMNAINQLMQGMWKTVDNFKEYIAELEKQKEEAKE